MLGPILFLLLPNDLTFGLKAHYSFLVRNVQLVRFTGRNDLKSGIRIAIHWAELWHF